MDDLTQELADRLRAATAARTTLRIVGGDTKRSYGREAPGERLDVAGHRGILNYDPAELVLTARSGTTLEEIDAALAARGQRLPFEPPRFGAAATLGGAVAAGLAGPARAWSGPLRDYVLGVRLLAGDGRVLKFGGEVMKNVAGYDIARLMAGSLGILGVLLEVSLKVLPRPSGERTRVVATDQARALQWLAELARSGMPLTASCWWDGRLYLRFEGSGMTLEQVAVKVGGEDLPDSERFWRDVREQTLPFFGTAGNTSPPLWRIHVPAMRAPLPARTEPLVEWNGMQRWYSGLDAREARALAAEAGGIATWFRGAPTGEEVFAPLPPPQLDLHRALKAVFDPAGVLNRGRLYGAL